MKKIEQKRNNICEIIITMIDDTTLILHVKNDSIESLREYCDMKFGNKWHRWSYYKNQLCDETVKIKKQI